MADWQLSSKHPRWVKSLLLVLNVYLYSFNIKLVSVRLSHIFEDIESSYYIITSKADTQHRLSITLLVDKCFHVPMSEGLTWVGIFTHISQT